jgi:hypothetical protein
MNRKAQLQMGESIFAVIIILLLIVFGIVFASNAEKDEITQDKEEFLDLDAITLSKYASSLAELQCSLLDVTELSCFDVDKMIAFINVTEKYPEISAEYYFSQFGNANITVREIYPSNRSWEVYYNGLKDGEIGRSKTTMVPVALYDGITKKKSFGVLIIKSISK